MNSLLLGQTCRLYARCQFRVRSIRQCNETPKTAGLFSFDSVRTLRNSYKYPPMENSEQELPVAPIVLTPKEKKQAALEYLKRRRVYRKQVHLLRKKYIAEVAQNRAIDDAEEKARQAAIRRGKLERQRLKNIRTAQNAIRQKAIHDKRHQEWREELHETQMRRDARNARYNKARQIVLDEMEAQAHLWLTTPEEVMEAFTNVEKTQLLWGKPGGVLGAPRPTADSDYWRLECHPWRADKYYPEKKELLLKQMLEEIYEEANVNPNVWTKERVAEHEEKVAKARLRAMVRLRGLALLLRKRSEFFLEAMPKGDELPKEAPVPDQRVFTNYQAMDYEGVRDLFDNPTLYFHFRNDDMSHDDYLSSENRSETVISDANAAANFVQKPYSGPTLGEPVALRDWIRDDTPGGTPYPVVVGKMPKVTAQSEREKKIQERENKLRAAAEAKMTEKERQEAELRAELEEDMDEVPYDETQFEEPELDDEDKEWVESLDPETDSDLMLLPPDAHFSEDDILWVIEKLEKESKNTDIMIRQAEEGVYQLRKAKEAEKTLKPSQVDSLKKIGLDPARVQKVMLSLNQEQTMALNAMQLTEEMSADEITQAYNNVPELTDEQRSELIEFDLALLRNQK